MMSPSETHAEKTFWSHWFPLRLVGALYENGSK